MTYFLTQLNRIRATHFANEDQLATVIGAKRYMDEHFAEPITLQLLSDVRFTSRYHLLRLFKKYYGQTPGQYLTDRRLARAKDYLKEGRSISETCYAVGFESPSSFSTLFRQREGCSPLVFQKKQFSQS